MDKVELRSDDFDRFFGIREKSLLERIEKAMGKQILPPSATDDTEEAVEYQESDEVAV